MIEVQEKPKRVERAFLVGILYPRDSKPEGESLMEELAELVQNLGINIAGSELVRSRKPQAQFLLGTGKTREIIAAARERSCDVIVFDDDLSPAQQRNWERESGDIAVIDRQEVILDIFAERAQTREAVLQVALARLEYNLPRLQRAWTHLNRQRSGGAVQRDAGETQLEMDQRLIRNRIARVKKQLVEVTRHRTVQRKQRVKIPVPTAAIVGYTNAGKSSLLNALTGSSVLVENKLFATLDPTSRRMRLPSGCVMVMTDTVGFVRKLPHNLVDAFKATLEEALVADLLIHVVDVSNPDYLKHRETTCQVLEELGADGKTMIQVLNKIDRVEPEEGRLTRLRERFPEDLPVSARTGEGIPALLDRIEQCVAATGAPLEFLVPHDRYDLVSRLHQSGSIERELADEDGVHLIARVPERFAVSYEPFRVNGLFPSSREEDSPSPQVHSSVR